MYEYDDLFVTGGDFLHHPPESDPSLPGLFPFPGNGYDTVRDALAVLKSETVGIGDFCSPSPSCPANYYAQRPNAMQRSVSSHSLLQKDVFVPVFSPHEFLGPQDGPMRRALSAGDIQRLQLSHRAESPSTHENCSLEGVTKTGRYSAEERRERIERYRSKRNQRNFHKKIKYACRKTLADSRPRVRGRFARNEEIGENSQVQWRQMGDEEDDDIWTNVLDEFPMNLTP